MGTVVEATDGDGVRPPRQDVARAASALRDLLRAELLRGDYDERPLPDEASLQRTHRASRGVVRAALELLRDEGLVERLRGMGTFVAARKSVHRTHGLHGLASDEREVLHEVVRREVVEAHSVLMDLLRVAPGEPVLRLDRHTCVAGEVVGLWVSYLPLALAAPVAEPAADLSGDWYDALERLLDRGLGTSHLATEAVPADEVVAASLGVRVGRPVLRLERLVHLADGSPVEYGVGRFRGDRLALASTRHRVQPGGADRSAAI